MDNKKFIISAALLCGIVASYLFFNYGFDRQSKNANSLVVGTTAGYAPFVSVNQRGEYEGFDIDVAEQIANTLGKELILKDLGSMTSLMMALEQGSIDVIIWGVSITEERLKKFAMIHYQGELTESYPLIFWNTIPDGVDSVDDMDGMTICVEPSSSQSAVLEKYKNIIVLPVEKVDDALLNIQYGKADAALLDPVIAKKFKNKFSAIKILDVPLAYADQVPGVGITIKQDNKNLTAQVQHAIDLLKRNGTLAVLEKRWNLE